ncbi:MAG: ArnT family glycosyltransferase [Verrucomicrobiales bacterium]
MKRSHNFWSGASTRTAWLAAVVALLLSLPIYLSHNQHAWFYHVDEVSKVGQIQEGHRNLRHPVLMLEATKVLLCGKEDPASQTVVEAGRTVTGIAAALAVAGGVWISAHLAGWLGASWAFLFLATMPELYRFARCFKEDTLLLASSVWVMVAAFSWWRNPNPRGLWLLGASVGIAASTKYVGASLLVPVLLLVVVRVKGGSLRRIFVLLGMAVLTFALINFRIWWDLPTFQFEVERELSYLVSGHHGMGKDVPHRFYYDYLEKHLAFPVWILTVLGAGLLARWARNTAWVWGAFLIWGMLLAVVLSFLPKVAETYILPVSFLGLWCATLGVAGIVQGLRRLSTSGAGLAGLAAAAVLWWVWQPNLQRLQLEKNAFLDDHNVRLRDAVMQYVPPDAVVIQDLRGQLQFEHPVFPHWPYRVFVDRYAYEGFDLWRNSEPLDDIYLVVARPDYYRFIEGYRPALDEGHERMSRGQKFYPALFEHGNLLFETMPGMNFYLQPGLRVYHVPKDKIHYLEATPGNF